MSLQLIALLFGILVCLVVMLLILARENHHEKQQLLSKTTHSSMKIQVFAPVEVVVFIETTYQSQTISLRFSIDYEARRNFNQNLPQFVTVGQQRLTVFELLGTDLAILEKLYLLLVAEAEAEYLLRMEFSMQNDQLG